MFNRTKLEEEADLSGHLEEYREMDYCSRRGIELPDDDEIETEPEEQEPEE